MIKHFLPAIACLAFVLGVFVQHSIDKMHDSQYVQGYHDGICWTVTQFYRGHPDWFKEDGVSTVCK